MGRLARGAWFLALSTFAGAACREPTTPPVAPTGDSSTSSLPPSAAAGPVGRALVTSVADLALIGYRLPDGAGIVAGENVLLGDFDGDGLGDPIVGAVGWTDAPTGNPNRGAAFALAAADAPGLCPAGSLIDGPICALDADPPQYTARLEGADVLGGMFGEALARGDLDRDGFEDLLVGAPGAGGAYLWYGGPGLLSGPPDAVIRGAPTLGIAVAVLGDLDADGCAEIGLGANEAADSLGEAYLLFSTPDGGGCARLAAEVVVSDLAAANALRIRGAALNDFAGTAVADAGDVDGDGVSDVLIGVPNAIQAPNGALGLGEVFLVYGGVGAREIGACGGGCDLSISDLGASGAYDAARYILPPQFPQHWLGRNVVGVGDVTGDGCGDFVVGAMKFSDGEVFQRGAAYFLDGAGACDGTERVVSDEIVLDGSGDDYVLRLLGNSYDDKLTEALAPAGDANGDGLADVLVGEYREDEEGQTKQSNTGAVYLVYGGWAGMDQQAPPTVVLGEHLCDAEGGWPAEVPRHLKIVGTDLHQMSGKLVAGGADVDGDGRMDALIGVPRWGATDTGCGEELCDEGAAFVVYGEAEGRCLVE